MHPRLPGYNQGLVHIVLSSLHLIQTWYRFASTKDLESCYQRMGVCCCYHPFMSDLDYTYSFYNPSLVHIDRDPAYLLCAGTAKSRDDPFEHRLDANHSFLVSSDLKEVAASDHKTTNLIMASLPRMVADVPLGHASAPHFPY